MRKEGGRGLTSIKHSVDALIQGLKDYIQKRGDLETILKMPGSTEQESENINGNKNNSMAVLSF